MPNNKKIRAKNSNCIRLRNIRKKMGMTVREFAKEVQVGFSTISQWENGTYPIPGPMIKLMDFYEERLGKNSEGKT